VPLVAPHFWESNRNKGVVVALLSAPILLFFPLALGERGAHELLEKGAEYVSFLCLLGSLFVVTGGIHVGGSLSGTPLANTFALGLGGVLFGGIFATMAPVLLYLHAHAVALGLAQPWQFYWVAGGLSSFLDNAPTYLTFAATAAGLHGVPLEGRYLADSSPAARRP